MSILNDFKQKVKQIICCIPSDVDQNEGPPPERQVSTSAQAQQQEQGIVQSTQNIDDMDTTAIIEEEQEEQEEEENWGDDEIEASPYDGQTFVVEADKYDKYKYDESQYNGDEELQKAFEVLVQTYSPSKRVDPTADEDASLVWGNRFYERPIWDWNPDQYIPARAQEAR